MAILYSAVILGQVDFYGYIGSYLRRLIIILALQYLTPLDRFIFWDSPSICLLALWYLEDKKP